MESCRRPVDLRKIDQRVSDMADGLNRTVTKFMERWCKKSCNNQQFIFWEEKHLRSGKAIGPNMQTFGQPLMMVQNTSSLKPGKSQIGKIQHSSKAWQISKS